MFDRYVIAQTGRSWKRRALIIASIVIHGVAGTVFVIWSFFHVEEIVPPSLSLTVFSAPPPAPPPPLGARRKTSAAKQQPQIEKPMTQPTEIPKLVQPEEKPPEQNLPEGDPNGDAVNG